MITIMSPMDERTVRDLRIGQIVYVSGTVVTGRDEMHMRVLSSGDAPKDLNGATLFHCGPIMRKEGNEWTAVAAGPTTSARMNTMGTEMIRRFRIRAIIGKGGMSDDVLNEMRETGCVYLAAVGGAAVSLAEGLKRVIGTEYDDLGMAEMMWIFEAERLGPLVVAMDADGNSIYNEVNSRIKERIEGLHS